MLELVAIMIICSIITFFGYVCGFVVIANISLAIGLIVFFFVFISAFNGKVNREDESGH